MRTLAIDFGSRRIGLALGDDFTCLASPYDVLQSSSPTQAMGAVLKMISRESVDRIVVGLPLNMDDTIGDSARQVIHWARELSSAVSKPLVFVDERLSSFAADQQIMDRRRAGDRLTRKRKKSRQDALAAASFLQAFLDGRAKAIDVSHI